MDTCARIARLAYEWGLDGYDRGELVMLFILRLFSGC
jgi:hypothetical protein